MWLHHPFSLPCRPLCFLLFCLLLSNIWFLFFLLLPYLISFGIILSIGVQLIFRVILITSHYDEHNMFAIPVGNCVHSKTFLKKSEWKHGGVFCPIPARWVHEGTAVVKHISYTSHVFLFLSACFMTFFCTWWMFLVSYFNF